MRKFREPLILIGIFIFAVAFRLWFISLAPQPFWWDQDEYEKYAAKMMERPFFLAANSYRSYPYPLFMAVIYSIFGFANHRAIFVIQAVIDAVTGILLYLIVSRGMKKQGTATAALLLYSVNPFTSGYVGLALSEVLSAFFITATIASGMRFIAKPSLWWGVLTGVLAGLSAETRNAAFFWSVIPIGLLVLYVPFKKHVRSYMAIGLGVIITLLYPLIVNWQTYRVISFTTVDSISAREFFNGAILKVLPPFTNWYPPQVQEMYREYYSEFYPQRTNEERAAMADKYMKKGWAIVMSDPADYIRTRFFKMWYVWQKENIFFIKEPGYEQHRPFTYWGNTVLLLCALAGLVVGWNAEKSLVWRYAMFCFLGTILYGTFAYSITHAEYRLTIPFYPVIIALAGIGGSRVYLLGRKVFRS